MTLNKTIACTVAAAAALIAASPAFAGPAGEGRHFTIETMHKHIAQRTVKVAAADQACLGVAAASLKTRDDVAGAAVKPGAVHVTFRTQADAAAGVQHVQAAVAKACA